MKADEAKSIMRMVKEATVADVIILSLIILPIILGAWNVIISVFGPSASARGWMNLILILLYVVGLIWMKKVETNDAKDERAKSLIVNHLAKFRQRSFQFIREKFGKEFTDEYLKRLITKYPNELRSQGIKRKGPGVALVIEDQQDRDT